MSIRELLKQTFFASSKQSEAEPEPESLKEPYYVVLRKQNRIFFGKPSTRDMWVLIEKRDENDVSLYQRLFEFERSSKILAAMSDEDFIQLCRKIEAEKFADQPPIPFAQLSRRMQEIIIRLLSNRMLYLYFDSDDVTVGKCTPQNFGWFKGFDVKAFREEICQLGFTNTKSTFLLDCAYRFSPETTDHYKNYIKYLMNGRTIRYMSYWTSLHLFSAVDWTGIDVFQYTDVPCPAFPEYEGEFPGPTEIRNETPNVAPPVVVRREDNKPRCPTCQSTDIEKISTLNKVASIELMGLASNKIGKQFKCKKCGYYW